jgi:hypothetical protein
MIEWNYKKHAHPLISYNFRIIDDPALLIVTADNIKFELKIKNSEGGLISAEIKDDLTEGPWVFCLCGATKRGKSRSRTHFESCNYNLERLVYMKLISRSVQLIRLKYRLHTRVEASRTRAGSAESDIQHRTNCVCDY